MLPNVTGTNPVANRVFGAGHQGCVLRPVSGQQDDSH